MKDRSSFLEKWLPIFIVGVLLIVVYKTLDNVDMLRNLVGDFFKIVSPFLFGILICYFTYVPSKKLEEAYKDINIKFISDRARLFGVLSVYLMVLLVILLIIMFIVPILFSSIIDLISNVPVYYNHTIGFIHSLSDSVGMDITSNLEEFTKVAVNKLLDPAFVDQFAKGMFGFANGILNALIALIISMYILLERENIFKFCNRVGETFFSKNTNALLKRQFKQIDRVLYTFIASKGMDSIINWVVITIILLVMGVQYAILLGIIAGIVNFIPYLGSLIGMMLISLLTLLTGGIDLALPIFIFLLIFQQIDGNYIEPKIMGTNLQISPILVIFAVIVGGAYFGILGMFLGVPVVTIIKQLLIEYMDSNNPPAIIINRVKPKTKSKA